MTMEVGEAQLSAFLKTAAEASGRSVTEEEVDTLVALIAAMAGQENTIDSDVELVLEDGEWLVCDSLDFLNNIGDLEFPMSP
jgi:hypothetical protein